MMQNRFRWRYHVPLRNDAIDENRVDDDDDDDGDDDDDE